MSKTSQLTDTLVRVVLGGPQPRPVVEVVPALLAVHPERVVPALAPDRPVPLHAAAPVTVALAPRTYVDVRDRVEERAGVRVQGGGGGILRADFPVHGPQRLPAQQRVVEGNELQLYVGRRHPLLQVELVVQVVWGPVWNWVEYDFAVPEGQRLRVLLGAQDLLRALPHLGRFLIEVVLAVDGEVLEGGPRLAVVHRLVDGHGARPDRPELEEDVGDLVALAEAEGEGDLALVQRRHAVGLPVRHVRSARVGQVGHGVRVLALAPAQLGGELGSDGVLHVRDLLVPLTVRTRLARPEVPALGQVDQRRVAPVHRDVIESPALLVLAGRRSCV